MYNKMEEGVFFVHGVCIGGEDRLAFSLRGERGGSSVVLGAFALAGGGGWWWVDTIVPMIIQYVDNGAWFIYI